MSVTLRDVALKAGVSIKTVSRVANNQGEISETTRQRVQAAISELGYRPSKVARALVTQRTDTIGLILGDITNQFFPEVARGVLDVAEARDLNVFVCNSDGDLQRELRTLQSLTEHGVDGVIISPSYEMEADLRAGASPDRPIVVINRPFDCPGISTVMMRSLEGACLAVDYLIAKGHTAIAMVGGPPSAARKLQRAQGYRTALASHGLPVVEEWVRPSLPVRSHGREATVELLTRWPQITAIFAYNDLVAIGAIEACQRLGRVVPRDCAVVGFDDIPLADSICPALTTVRVDKYELGRRAMDRLAQMLASPHETFEPLWMDVDLVIRQSA